jgi:hypothetical protein
MNHERKPEVMCAAATLLFTIAMLITAVSYAQTVTIGDKGHSFTTTALGINSGPNPKRLALLRWYTAMNSSANFAAATGSTGIAFDGANIWTANRDGSNPSNSVITAHRSHNGEKIIDVDVDNVAVNARCLGPVALAYDGQFMWCVCRDNDAVVRLSAINGALQGISLPTGSGPVFIEFVGDRMWISNFLDNSLSIYNANPPYNLDYTPTDLISPYGMASDGTNMWVASGTTNTVTVYSLNNPSSLLSTFNVGGSSLDIAFDGANMWISHFTQNRITIRNAANGSLVKELTTADNVGTKPTYMVFDGVFMWVVNEDDHTLSAFRANDFQHAATVDAGGASSVPQQIAFDGANVWVANSATGTISKR